MSLVDVPAPLRAAARRLRESGGVSPEDVVQETLLAVHLKRDTWRTDEPILPKRISRNNYNIFSCIAHAIKKIFF
jgi:hypothetical protein